MALILHLPTLKDKPVMIAETRPQKIIPYLENLQAQSIPVGSSSLLRQLVELNRQKVPPGNRIEALDLYRPVVGLVTQLLAQSYTDAALPLQTHIKSTTSNAESLWLELGHGYKLALVDLQNQLIKKGQTTAHCIQQAMLAIMEYAMVHYQTYTTPPAHVWSDLHQLYFCAVQLGVQNQRSTGKNNEVSASKNQTLTPSIENIYKQALLIFLADTQRLTPHEMRQTADLLAAHVNKTYISAVAPLESPAASFIIHLQSNDPPTPYTKQQVAPNPNTDILLLTIDLVKALHSQLGNLQNNALASESRDGEIALLTHLIKYWGITPKRIFRRLAKNGDLELVSGLPAIHLHADMTSAFNNDTKPIAPSRWQILNISPAGISIRRHPTADKNIKIGSLIGIKAKNEKQWSLGVVRWASCGVRDKLDIGVQLIAPHSEGATARFDNHNQDENIMLVPPNNATKVNASIIVPRGTFEPARKMAINTGNETKYGLLTKLIDHTPHYEQALYSLID